MALHGKQVAKQTTFCWWWGCDVCSGCELQCKLKAVIQLSGSQMQNRTLDPLARARRTTGGLTTAAQQERDKCEPRKPALPYWRMLSPLSLAHTAALVHLSPTKQIYWTMNLTSVFNELSKHTQYQHEDLPLSCCLYKAVLRTLHMYTALHK